MLQVAEAPLKREYVLVMPDLVHDGQHKEAVQLLSELLQEDSQFTAPALESLSSLHMDADDEEEVCTLVVGAVASAKAADLPCIVRFLLAHLGAANAAEVTTALRSGLSAELLSSDAADAAGRGGGGVGGGGGGGNAGAEALLLDALLSALRLRGDLGPLLLTQLEGIKKAAEHKPIDWWLLCALSQAGDAKSKQRTAKLIADKAARHLMPLPLLRNAISGHHDALLPHYPTQLGIAASLVRSASAAARALGGQVYTLLFEEFAQAHLRQELIGELLTHAGSGGASEVDAALSVLVQMATANAKALAVFSSFLTGVLDYLDGLTVPQARLAFELFARIAYDAGESGGSRLADELHITIRKQLTSPAPRYKSLGVLGGCCLLGRLGAREAGAGGAHGAAAAADAEDSAPELDPERKQDAQKLLELMLKNASAPDGSFGFLLHELSLLVAARGSDGVSPTLHAEIVELIKDDITYAFEDEYLHDVEALPVAPPHVRGVRPELALALQVEPDEEAPGIAVNLLDGRAHV